MIDTQSIYARIDSLPGLPDSVVKLSALVNDKEASVADYEKAVRPDPALTANLLRIANSALYKRTREIDTVRQAIAVLGERRVFELAVADSMTELIPDELPGYNVPSRQFWLHNVAVAIMSERLARALDLDAPDMIFTVGLLHDIGKLVIGAFLAGCQSEVLQQLTRTRKSLAQVEREMLGLTHCEVGEEITRRWNLPEAISVVARWHHKPSDVSDQKYQRLVDLVHVADSLSYSIGYGNDVGELAREVDREAVTRLKVATPLLEKIISETHGDVIEVSDIFNSKQG